MDGRTVGRQYDTIAPPALSAGLRNETTTRIHGRALVLARAAWIAVTLVVLALFAFSIAPFFEQLRTPSPHAVTQGGQLTPSQARALAQLGLSSSFYAAYVVALDVMVALAVAAIAIVIVWRRSDDWMVLFVSLTLLLIGIAGPPPLLALAERHPVWQLPVAFLRALAWALGILFFYLFPDGRFVPRWTRWLAGIWIGYLLCGIFVPGLRPPRGFFTVEHWTDILRHVWFSAWLIGGLLAQVYRYRRVSHVILRQQTKWAVFGVAATALILSGILLPVLFFPALRQPGPAAMLYRLAAITSVLLVLLLNPLAIAIAILRYRLFEIDVIINRALVYATLTATLALIYFGSVVVLQRAVQGVTGSTSQLTVVVSTLVVAALFQPLRRRIQESIDHRFYRRKYDAARTLQTFSAKIRDEVDLNRLTDDLLAVVEETMQPAHVSLWLRDVPARRQPEG